MGDLQEPWSIGSERWENAEKATQKIISQFQPTDVSEERRREVIDYVQRLIRGYLGCEVFPYGSVPLKTYLPDGDIDLTAFGSANMEDSLVNDIVSVLEGEEQNRATDFVVKDVQLIRAEVKLVKCLVQNIVVDISFNQIGGLCTLCFLEQVDRRIGKDHLFKQSIILIKAWCYYESRILGAHHGLIATYALETLVLYIFHVFHTMLDGPLAVLYKFLDYFSKFDWENYCVSLIGPVRISALPEIVAEAPENGGDLLLSSEFLKNCSDMFSVPSKGVGTFPQKHLNIIDPLKETNNLGRSVSKGNFYRIRSAFAFGAKKLRRILIEPGDNIADGLRSFFSNTLDRHRSGQRPDVQDYFPRSTLSVDAPPFSISATEPCLEDKINSGLKSDKCIGSGEDHKQNPDGSSQDGVENLTDDSDDSPKVSTESGEESVSPVGAPFHAPHLYFSNAMSGNVKMECENLDTKQSENYENKVSSDIPRAPNDEQGNDEVLTSVGSKSKEENCENKVSSEFNSSDLRGDYDSHFISMQYGRWCHEYVWSVPAVITPPLPPSHFQSMNLCDPSQHSLSHFKKNGFPNGSVNGIIHGPVFYAMNQMLIPGVALGLEEMPKQRGTGTYIPNMKRPPYGYSPSTVKGRNHVQARSPRSNGRAITFADANMLEKSYLELSKSQFPVDQGGETLKSSVFHLSNSSRRNLNPNANGFVPQPEGVAEYGLVGHRMPPPQTSSQGFPAPGVQRPKPGVNRY